MNKRLEVARESRTGGSFHLFSFFLSFFFSCVLSFFVSVPGCFTDIIQHTSTTLRLDVCKHFPNLIKDFSTTLCCVGEREVKAITRMEPKSNSSKWRAWKIFLNFYRKILLWLDGNFSSCACLAWGGRAVRNTRKKESLLSFNLKESLQVSQMSSYPVCFGARRSSSRVCGGEKSGSLRVFWSSYEFHCLCSSSNFRFTKKKKERDEKKSFSSKTSFWLVWSSPPLPRRAVDDDEWRWSVFMQNQIARKSAFGEL